MPSERLDPGAPGWPVALAALGDVPLFVAGLLPRLPGVAIVGTRTPSDDDLAMARALAVAFVERGFAVWSGGALGVDAAAHEAALDAGGVTVAVLGGGLERRYPREHDALFDRVLDEGGALVSRAPDDAAPSPLRFFARNGALVALTRATFVVAAGVKSGARNAASWARRLGRPLGVVPHAPWDPIGQGCALELVLGASAIASTSDALRLAGLEGRRARKTPELPLLRSPPPRLERPPPADPLLRRALGGLDATARHLDEVAERAALGGAEASAAMLALVLDGFVAEGPPGFFRRS